jgi:myo-inositol-1(or 4)-monophosphatase
MIDQGLLMRLAEPAVACALDYAGRREGLAVAEKTRGQFASEADEAVEQVIRMNLNAVFGDVALLGEEGGGGLDAQGSGWVIDPIDGTSNFLRGLPLWGISMGYVARGEVVAGLIALPELGVTLCAARGAGVWRNGAPFVPPDAPAIRLMALGENDHETGAETDARAEGLREAGYAVTRYGCATFSLASAALRWTDGYVEHGCRLWDIAAGMVICREAGLSVAAAEIAPARWSIEVRG